MGWHLNVTSTFAQLLLLVPSPDSFTAVEFCLSHLHGTRYSWAGCSASFLTYNWNPQSIQECFLYLHQKVLNKRNIQKQTTKLTAQIYQHQAFGCLFFLELLFFLFADPPLLCLFFRSRLGPILHGFFHLTAFQNLNYKAPESRWRVSPCTGWKVSLKPVPSYALGLALHVPFNVMYCFKWHFRVFHRSDGLFLKHLLGQEQHPIFFIAPTVIIWLNILEELLPATAPNSRIWVDVIRLGDGDSLVDIGHIADRIWFNLPL